MSVTSHRIMFLRNEMNHAIGCLAIRLNRSAGTVEYNLSVLNPLDRFDRAVARQLAIGRLVEKPFALPIEKQWGMNEISVAVMTHLEKNKLAPKRAQRSAHMWLHQSA